MKRFLAVLVLFGNLLRGCCSETPRIEPAYPNEISGWNERRDRGLRILGNILLIKNQTTDNGKLQIKVLDLIHGDPCAEAGTYSHQAKAILQFTRLSDHKVLCEDTFLEKGSMTVSAGKCGTNLAEFGIIGVYVSAINLSDSWVFFELRG